MPVHAENLSPAAMAQKERLLCLRGKTEPAECDRKGIEMLESIIGTLPSETFHEKMIVVDSLRSLAGMRFAALARLREARGANAKIPIQALLEAGRHMENALDLWIETAPENAGSVHARNAALTWQFVNARLDALLQEERERR